MGRLIIIREGRNGGKEGQREKERVGGRDRGREERGVTRTKWEVKAEGQLEYKSLACVGSCLPIRRAKVKQNKNNKSKRTIKGKPTESSEYHETKAVLCGKSIQACVKQARVNGN